jgi:hypothetical protein
MGVAHENCGKGDHCRTVLLNHPDGSAKGCATDRLFADSGRSKNLRVIARLCRDMEKQARQRLQSLYIGVGLLLGAARERDVAVAERWTTCVLRQMFEPLGKAGLGGAGVMGSGFACLRGCACQDALMCSNQSSGCLFCACCFGVQKQGHDSGTQDAMPGVYWPRQLARRKDMSMQDATNVGDGCRDGNRCRSWQVDVEIAAVVASKGGQS